MWWSDRLEFSGVALLSLLYSPKWKRNLLAKKRYGTFLYDRLWTAGCSRIMQCERNILLERGLFCPFHEKKTRGPREPSFSRKIKQKWSEKLKMTFLNRFYQGGHPERGQNVRGAPTVIARLDRTSLARGHAEDHRIEFSVRSIEVTVWGRSSETGAADRAGSVRTLPSAVLLPTIGNWAHMTWKCPQSPQKVG